ncbi:hypothetical protein J7E81_22480 [Bacillus sp. ISL-18]|uniref:hypothetical protein n=1 Tax=Bacillus sp. ISL-18 TaxID=2819118 RepID=UPI001BE4EB4A|nr:hypothetical protein [Bacillus sp. ISL-18]MBT2657969.1 hypothetical protein [Bacillus sp. ISL-18]
MSDRKYELLNAFPTNLEDDVMVVLRQIKQTNTLDFSCCFEVNICGNLLIIPERIYYNEPSSSQLNSLSEQQQVILACLFTRHHNGFVREENLRKIIHLSNHYIWIIPNLIRLTGEYVIEILQVIKSNLDKVNKGILKDFIVDNPKFYKTTESRVVSYWDCYYRKLYPNKEDYIGYEIIQYFRSLFK